MSKSRYVTGLRAVEQLLASGKTEVRKLYAEYQTANPRVEALTAKARERGVEILAANRARLQQISCICDGYDDREIKLKIQSKKENYLEPFFDGVIQLFFG